MNKMKAIVFDLDNTLYDAEDFFIISFQKISKELSEISSFSSDIIFSMLYSLWKEKTSMYPYLFNEILTELKLNEYLIDVINMFNQFEGTLTPYSDVIKTLNYFKEKGHLLGIVTDGNAARQKKKIVALNLIKYFDLIIYTDNLKQPKPSVIPFQKVLDGLGCPPHLSSYVGDNPVIDFIGSKRIGMNTIRIRKGEFCHLKSGIDVDYEIMEIYELKRILGS